MVTLTRVFVIVVFLLISLFSVCWACSGIVRLRVVGLVWSAGIAFGLLGLLGCVVGSFELAFGSLN